MSDLPRRIFLFSAAATLLGAKVSLADTGSPPAGRRIALSGYDPVAYFTDGRPEKGSERTLVCVRRRDLPVPQRRASRAIFAADPERYAPQYDGFCAAGVSKATRPEPDPEAWVIANGKLYAHAQGAGARLQTRTAPSSTRPTVGRHCGRLRSNHPRTRPSAARDDLLPVLRIAKQRRSSPSRKTGCGAALRRARGRIRPCVPHPHALPPASPG